MRNEADGAGVFLHRGMCDASAAVALADGRFIVADDESNVLHVYGAGEGLLAEQDLTGYLRVAGGGEADLEGAAVVKARIWWIGSHGCDRKGRPSPARRQLFATDLAGRPVDAPPYRHLFEDLITHPPLLPYRLAEAALLPPKAEGGLCIEGLTATPAGDLLIGLRNPVPNGWALLIPLHDPEVLLRGGRAQLGAPVRLDLGGNGIREIAHLDDMFCIAAGPAGEQGASALYRWSGRVAEAPQLLDVPALAHLNPEALFFDSERRLHVLSDDGARRVDGVKCKALPAAQRAFRRIVLGPDAYLA